MKKIKSVLLLLALNFCMLSSYAQENRVVGSTCTCGAGQSMCVSDCTFSECCICWNPGTQNGACGCYWGVATCKSAKIDASRGLTMDDNTFGEVNPEAKISFKFDAFKKLSTFFKKCR